MRTNQHSMALKQTLLLFLLSTSNGFVTPPQPHSSLQRSPRITTATTTPPTHHSTPTHLSLSFPSPPSLDPKLSQDLLLYFLQTIISVGVPTLATIAVIAFTAGAFSRRRDQSDYDSPSALMEELYSDLYGPPPPSSQKFINPFQRQKQNALRNLGVPTEQYIKITKWNDVLNSYQYSLNSALKSKARAAAEYRQSNFESAFGKIAFDLSTQDRGELLKIEKEFLKTGSEILKDMERLQKELVGNVIGRKMKSMKVEIGDVDVIDVTNSTSVESKEKPGWMKMMDPEQRRFNKKMDVMKELNGELQELELAFVKDVVEILGAERANGVRVALLGNIEGGEGVSAGSLLRSLKERPLSTILNSLSPTTTTTTRQNLFVTNFPGDVTASQVSDLREEVTAIIRNANPGDEALVVLQSGGGTVTGYGLAAAQLQRFREHGMKLTICVEQVAASGGYMMCCVADRIVASPMAVLGSIGVITDIPNVYDRLKSEGIEFQTVTAGKYKRTLTPTKKPTKDDFDKTKADIEDVLKLFKSFVKQNRPSLDIDTVATGETWFGEDALQKKLCDEINTKDDVLLEFVDNGFNVYEVKYDPPKENPIGALGFAGAESKGKSGNGLLGWLVKSLVKEVKNELMSGDILSELGGDKGSATRKVRDRYMARSDVKDRIRVED